MNDSCSHGHSCHLGRLWHLQSKRVLEYSEFIQPIYIYWELGAVPVPFHRRPFPFPEARPWRGLPRARSGTCRPGPGTAGGSPAPPGIELRDGSCGRSGALRAHPSKAGRLVFPAVRAPLGWRAPGAAVLSLRALRTCSKPKWLYTLVVCTRESERFLSSLGLQMRRRFYQVLF